MAVRPGFIPTIINSIIKTKFRYIVQELENSDLIQILSPGKDTRKFTQNSVKACLQYNMRYLSNNSPRFGDRYLKHVPNYFYLVLFDFKTFLRKSFTKTLEQYRDEQGFLFLNLLNYTV